MLEKKICESVIEMRVKKENLWMRMVYRRPENNKMLKTVIIELHKGVLERTVLDRGT